MEKDFDSVYFEYRKHLIESRRQTYEQFDKAIFILSGGGLTVSLAFLKDIVPLKTAQFKPLLACTWLFFTLSLVLTLLSFILSRRAVDKQIQNAEDYFVKKDKEAINRKNIFSTITEYVNYSSAGAFLIGLVFLLLFVYWNIF
jgi:hypothetical protein